MTTHKLSPFHRAYHKLFPAIRYLYTQILGHNWFDQITPHDEIREELWLGGAPSNADDYAFLLEHGIGAVVNIRSEQADDEDFYDQHDITHARFHVPDVAVPDIAVITAGADWITDQVADGRAVLVHCAKGRGRSATVLAAYLIRERGLSYDQARELLKVKRPLTSLDGRHRAQLEAWVATDSKS